MPKSALSPAQKKYKARSDNIRGLIVGEMERFGHTNDSIASKSLININTFKHKKNDVMSFKLDEFYRLADALHIKILIIREEGPDET